LQGRCFQNPRSIITYFRLYIVVDVASAGNVYPYNILLLLLYNTIRKRTNIILLCLFYSGHTIILYIKNYTIYSGPVSSPRLGHLQQDCLCIGTVFFSFLFSSAPVSHRQLKNNSENFPHNSLMPCVPFLISK